MINICFNMDCSFIFHLMDIPVSDQNYLDAICVCIYKYVVATIILKKSATLLV